MYNTNKWEEVERREFTEQEKKQVKEAYVVDSDFGDSVCFTMVNGMKSFIPLSNTSSLSVGEVVDLENAQIITLKKEGEANTITRIDA